MHPQSGTVHSGLTAFIVLAGPTRHTLLFHFSPDAMCSTIFHFWTKSKDCLHSKKSIILLFGCCLSHDPPVFITTYIWAQ